MRIQSYLASRYVGAVVLTATVLVAMVTAVRIAEDAGKFVFMKDHPLSLSLSMVLYTVVEFCYRVLPLACFLGALVTTALLARGGELLGMQAVGCSTRRMALVLCACSMGIATVGYVWGDKVVPSAVAEYDQLHRMVFKTRGDRLGAYFDRRTEWYLYGDYVLFLPLMRRNEQVFIDPVLYRHGETGITEIIEAERLSHDGQGWLAMNAETRTFPDGVVDRHPQLRIDLDLEPRDLFDVTGNPRKMSASEVRGLIERRARAGFDVTVHTVELHSRYAYPLLGLWMILIVLPWIVNPDHRRSLVTSLGVGVVGIALAMAGLQVLRVLALGHKIPAPMGAWGVGLACLIASPVSFAVFRWLRR